MSITADYYSVSTDFAEKLLNDNTLIYELLFESEFSDLSIEKRTLEKTWHILHVLLCGHSEPDGTILGNCILGGQPFGDEMDYGYPRYFDQNTVNLIYDELKDTELSSQIRLHADKVKQLEDIYCSDELGADDSSELQYYFSELVGIFKHAVENENCVVTVLV